MWRHMRKFTPTTNNKNKHKHKSSSVQKVEDGGGGRLPNLTQAKVSSVLLTSKIGARFALWSLKRIFDGF